MASVRLWNVFGASPLTRRERGSNRGRWTMARVVVTGGAGKLGRACVDELLHHGWDVVVFDRMRPPSGAVFIPIDLTDYGQGLDAMLGGGEGKARPEGWFTLPR